MKFGSVCSGIEAASVAWQPLGWKAAWLAEIEPFPSAVLAHHYPDVPNLGDMTKIADMVRRGEVEAPDIFCGGTPCQAFSVAGLRKSLDDARGNLSLTFCEIANEIDARRLNDGDVPCIIFWENVPGVLNTKDNAFGCFLAGLAGEDDPLVAPGGKWTNAGCVLGPKRAVAWRVLDAQYFGVAQRRRRVFVVASARAGFDPAAVLFEFDGVRRDSAPCREAGQDTAGTLAIRTTGGGFPGTDEACSGYLQPVIMAHGQGGAEIRTDGGAPCLTCNHEAPIVVHGTQDPDTLRDMAHTLGRNQGQENAVCVTGQITHTLRAEGADASEDGTGRGTPIIALSVALRGRDGGATAELGDDIAGCLRASSGGGDKPHVLAYATREVAQTITSNYGKQVDNSDTALGPNVAIAYTTKLHNTASNNAGKLFEERTPCLDANSPAPALLTASQVRRLTPVECERLQGFNDNYTAIPWRKKPASECPDGPRYKALGNSWAVPVVAWIGRRIDAHVKQLQHANDNTKNQSEAAA